MEAGQAKVRRLERLDAGVLVCTVSGRCRRRCDGRQRARDGMDAVKGAGEDEIVVGVELLESWRKVAVVDESTGLVDDEQCEDDPGKRRWSALLHVLSSSSICLHGELRATTTVDCPAVSMSFSARTSSQQCGEGGVDLQQRRRACPSAPHKHLGPFATSRWIVTSQFANLCLSL